MCHKDIWGAEIYLLQNRTANGRNKKRRLE
jgi:hypothetical protein